VASALQRRIWQPPSVQKQASQSHGNQSAQFLLRGKRHGREIDRDENDKDDTDFAYSTGYTVCTMCETNKAGLQAKYTNGRPMVDSGARKRTRCHGRA
jgi:hypothetical protein